jgi:Flp pilus assembly pilin Flp
MWMTTTRGVRRARLAFAADAGGVAAEYAILIAAIALAIIVGATALGAALASHYSGAATAVGS